MSITEYAIRRTMEELALTGGALKHACFALLYLEREYRLERAVALRHVALELGETTLNAFYYDEKRKTFHLFACTWTTAVERLKDAILPLLNGGLSTVLEPGNELGDEFLRALRGALDTHSTGIKRVSLNIVFAGNVDELERSATLGQLREDLERKSYLLKDLFKQHVAFSIIYRSASSRETGPRSEVRSARSFQLSMVETITRKGPAAEVMRIGFVPMLDLLSMYRQLGQAFFERNIRAGLSDDEAPNRAIAAALRRIVTELSEDPRVFAFNHNGVTIYAESLTTEGQEVTLTEPRLLNGAQTVTTFSRFVNKFDAQLRMPEQKKALRALQVMCKVITGAQPDFVVNVTINNNRQNPVMPWSLHANDMIQLQIQDWLAKVAGVYYERQENAFSHLTIEDLHELDIHESSGRAVKMLELAKTFLALEGEVEKMSSMKEVFERDDLYAKVFNEERMRAEPRCLLLCYKIHFRLRRALQEIVARGQTKYWYIKRARNLVWALLCQAILNDERLERRAEDHGHDLVADADFTQWITDLASARVRPLVGSVAEAPRYEEALANGKTDFLRSRAFFEASMDLGRLRYGWSHKKLK